MIGANAAALADVPENAFVVATISQMNSQTSVRQFGQHCRARAFSGRGSGAGVLGVVLVQPRGGEPSR